MNTHRIACIEMDKTRIAEDLRHAAAFEFNDSYSEFFCGEWRSCMLWNGTGDIADTHLTRHEKPAVETAYGHQLGYLHELMAATFDLSQLRFARLVKLCPNSVIIPHRDYLELGNALRRVHVPLQTDAACMSAEHSTVYHMDVGEVWYIDASKVHSAASFSHQDRLHLIMDFSPGNDVASLLRIPTAAEQVIPAGNLIARPELDAQDERALMALSEVIDEENWRDILALVIRRYFRRMFDAASIFDRLAEMARRAGKATLMEQICRHRDYYLVVR
jgi:hypothetical protein